ncbi:hypothetical protein, conserved (fragment), partial [Trypanosoma vivax Y486]
MFVLPAMTATPPASMSTLDTLSGPESLEPKLAPSLLSMWGIPFHSPMPTEGVERTAIVREYLVGLALWVRAFNISINKVFGRAIMRTINDEAIERGFIEEDSDFLAWKCFTELSRTAAIERLVRREEARRTLVIDSFFSSGLQLLDRLEALHRQHVCMQFLDSVFLKHCQWASGWTWQHVPPPNNEALSEALISWSWMPMLIKEEQVARKRVMNEFFSGILRALEVFAATEKRFMYMWDSGSRV